MELQTSCPEHVFVSSRFLSDHFPPAPFKEFLLEVYSKRHQSGLLGRGAMRLAGLDESSLLQEGSEGGAGLGLDFEAGDSRLPSNLRHRF